MNWGSYWNDFFIPASVFHGIFVANLFCYYFISSGNEIIINPFILYQLTNREREIVGLICRGYSYKQIAENLFIAERTVTKHVQNIFDKVRVANKLELLNKLGIVATN